MRLLTLALTALALAATASAQTRSVHTEELTWYEIRDAMASGTTTAIVYTGGTEQNGPHMALAKHNVIAHYVAGQVAERLGNALVFPVLPFSPAGDVATKTGHMRLPGTVSLSPEVYVGVVRNVAQSAAAAGFTQIFLIAEHGQGLAEIELAAQGVDAEWRARGVRVHYVPTTAASEQTNAYFKEHGITGGGHAAVAETAQVMFLDRNNSLIRRDQLAVSAKESQETTGVGGDPTPATAEMGRQFLEYKIETVVNQIGVLRAQDLAEATRGR
jgi:creatinine amidohydrolase/Fe(II)-dependent formamide hydrolase-like protein